MFIQSEWSTVKLDELNQDSLPICYGVLKPGEPSSDGIPMLRVKDISSNKLDFSDVLKISHQLDGEFSRSRLSGNEILISVQGTVGRVVLADSRVKNFNISRTIAKITLVGDVCRRFIRYYLLSPFGANSIGEQSGGTTRASLNIGDLRDLIVPLPPLAEQKVIADKLDTLLAQVDNTKARLERIPEILKSFRQSVLVAAVSGKLTEEWREEREDQSVSWSVVKFRKEEIFQESDLYKQQWKRKLPENIGKVEAEIPVPSDLPTNWDWAALYSVSTVDKFSIVDGPFGSDLKTSDYIDEKGVPVLTISMMYDIDDLSNARQISIEKFESLKRSKVKGGDILVAKIGSTYGLTCLYPQEHPDAIIPANMCKITVFEEFFLSKYVELWLKSEPFKQFLNSIVSFSAQPAFNVGNFKKLPIPIPPIVEQTEIVRRVEELFAYADRIEQAAQAAQSRVNNLTQSILAKAFRGELTADWRAANPELISGENSAEALLARIKAERAKVKARKKT